MKISYSLLLLATAVVLGVACSKALPSATVENKLNTTGNIKELSAADFAKATAAAQGATHDFLVYSFAFSKYRKSATDLGLIDAKDESPEERKVRRLSELMKNCEVPANGTDMQYVQQVFLFDGFYRTVNNVLSFQKPFKTVIPSIGIGGANCLMPVSFDTSIDAQSPTEYRGSSHLSFAAKGEAQEYFDLLELKIQRRFQYLNTNLGGERHRGEGRHEALGHLIHKEHGRFDITARMVERCDFEKDSREDELAPCERIAEILIEQGQIRLYAKAEDKEEPKQSEAWYYNNTSIEEKDFAKLFFNNKRLRDPYDR